MFDLMEYSCECGVFVLVVYVNGIMVGKVVLMVEGKLVLFVLVLVVEGVWY